MFLSPSARLRPPPDPIEVSELTATSIPEAWQDGKTNALAIATTLSTKRGLSLPWSTVQSAIDDAIRARWLVLSKESATWPSNLAGAQLVVLRTAEVHAGGVAERPQILRQATGNPDCRGRNWKQTASRTWPNRCQNSSLPLSEANLKFNIRIEFGGETVPDEESVEQINSLLSDVTEELRLS